MLNLKDEQVQFIQKELGIGMEELERVSKSRWKQIREECFDISVEELLSEVGRSGDYVTNRCSMAESIADMKYSELF